jgi:hypothetical protein
MYLLRNCYPASDRNDPQLDSLVNPILVEGENHLAADSSRQCGVIVAPHGFQRSRILATARRTPWLCAVRVG